MLTKTHQDAVNRSIARSANESPNSLTATDIRILGRNYERMATELEVARTAMEQAISDLVSAGMDPKRQSKAADKVLGDLRRALEG